MPGGQRSVIRKPNLYVHVLVIKTNKNSDFFLILISSGGANWGSAHLINKLVVQKTMDPVDAHVGEEQEGDHADDNSCPTWERESERAGCMLTYHRVHSPSRLSDIPRFFISHWLTQWIIVNIVVQFAVSSDFSKEQRHCGDADPRQGCHGVFNLPLNLILQGAKTHRKYLWSTQSWPPGTGAMPVSVPQGSAGASSGCGQRQRNSWWPPGPGRGQQPPG